MVNKMERGPRMGRLRSLHVAVAGLHCSFRYAHPRRQRHGDLVEQDEERLLDQVAHRLSGGLDLGLPL